MYMKRLVLLLTNIYWIFNIVILLVLTNKDYTFDTMYMLEEPLFYRGSSKV